MDVDSQSKKVYANGYAITGFFDIYSPRIKNRTYYGLNV